MDFSAHNPAFISTFGEEVFYTSPPSDPVSLQGISEMPMREDDGSSYKRIWFLVAAGFDPQIGDFLEKNGVTYRIVKVHPDELGGIWLSIEKV